MFCKILWGDVDGYLFIGNTEIILYFVVGIIEFFSDLEEFAGAVFSFFGLSFFKVFSMMLA